MSILESLFRFLKGAFCGPPKLEQPPDHQQQQQYGEPVSYPPQQHHQQQYGKPYHYNDYLANAQEPHYVSLRQQAQDLDPEIDRLFDASREAYKRDDHKAAKEFSNQAKEVKARKESLNREAADWIFERNNSGREPGEIDLHGLRVEEAVERTEQFIDDCRKRGITDLRLIVGKGLHSQNNGAVLKPRIEELMEKQNIIAELDPDNSGVLLVHLDSGAPTRGRTIDSGEITRRLGDKDGGCIIM